MIAGWEDMETLRAELALSAVGVTDVILDAAVRKIDSVFGKGYAKANPALVGQYLDATARTFQNDMSNYARMQEDEALDAAFLGPDDKD